MPENIKQIAMRIKDLREIEGLTAEAAATAFKIPVSTLKEYESGKTDIPVSFLYEVAQKFNVELTALLTGEEPRMKVYSLVRAGKAPEVDRSKDYNYRDLAYNFIHKKGEFFMVTADTKKNRKLHFNTHPGQEFSYVLEGTVKVVIDGHEVVLEKGDSLFFDSGKKHAMEAMKGKRAKFLAVIL